MVTHDWEVFLVNADSLVFYSQSRCVLQRKIQTYSV